MANSVTVKLSKPLPGIGGAPIETLELTKPAAGILRKIKGNMAVDAFEMTAQYLEFATNLPTTSINEMDPADFIECVAAFGGFFGNSPPTG